MSDIIHLLPDTVANQIAAGEVIQRPASVVKELVENSLDAGATLIQVLVNEAGKSVIQVTDNGKGMSEMDARMAFERHATSKISKATDLFALQTMGFRGEALASIAAVSQVELRTRRSETEVGIMISVHGGKVIEQQPMACPLGASFIVRNLFFNIPARRKFLKRNQTELSNIIQELERIALAHPDIAFKFYSNDVLLTDLHESSFKRRIVSLFGQKFDRMLLPLDVDTAPAHIVGFVGKPDSARKKGAKQFFFVNGRYMRHPYFTKAVQSAYERLIPEGQQVPFFLNFVVDPATIDVNIHPTKTEIKFDDEGTLWHIIQAAVRESLAKYSEVPMIDFDVENKPNIPAFEPEEAPIEVDISLDKDYNPFEDEEDEQPRNWQEAYDRAFGVKDTPSDDLLARDVDFLKSVKTPNIGVSTAPVVTLPTEEEESQPLFSLPEETEKASTEEEEVSAMADDFSNVSETQFFHFNNKYVVMSISSGIMVVDQHRAHVRILFDKYMRRLEQKQVAVQRLLFPTIVEFSPSEAPYVETLLPELVNVGFELKKMTVSEYEIEGVPAGTEGQDPASLLLDVVHEVMETKGDVEKTLHFGIALGMARRTALSEGDVLTSLQTSTLLRDLFATAMPAYTPDGKKIYVVIGSDKVERMMT